MSDAGVTTDLDTDAGYAALRQGALLIDLSDRSRGVFHGPRAAEVINGLVTNEVVALAPGQGTYAVALTPKGKVIADPLILRRADEVFVDVPGAAAPGWWSMVRKYVNPRLSRSEDVSGVLGEVGIFGPSASAILEAAGVAGADALGMHEHRDDMIAGLPVTVVRVPDAGVQGYFVYAAADAQDTIRQSLIRAGATPGEGHVLEIARVEAGRPTWGMDMDETTLTQEARLDELGAVSYTKGCYTGQETVARVHFRGHVNRLLRGFQVPGGEGVPRGASLVREDGTPVGDVRRSVRSPRLGAIGLALVRREVEPTTTLRAQWGDAGEGVAVVVVALPFPG